MDGKSLDIQEAQVEKLKELFPEVVSEGKVDWEKLKATLGEDVTFSNERYVLNWAGKSEAFRVLQEPTTATLSPAKDESVNFEDTGHVFIEGENLEVLKVLQKSYYGKVKMIYIDPPYNTGNDHFIYPDKFSESREEYLKRVGEKDEEGYLTREGMYRKNSRDSGHYHSNWLNMMYPRLFLARNLLKDDGVIFVSIDDNEVHNLRLLMNEIFGEENFVASFIWEKRTNRENRKLISIRHDYILCYSKADVEGKRSLNLLPMTDDALARYKNPDNDPRGRWKSDPATAQAGHGTKSQFYELQAPSGKKHMLQSGRCWVYSKDVMEKAIEEGKIWFGKDGKGVPRVKTYLNTKERGLTPESLLFAEEASTTEGAKNYIKELFDGYAVFETPKPVSLIDVLLKLGSDNEGVVLDFFAGSCPTSEAVLRLNRKTGGNRKFICVQLPEETDEQSEAFKAGYSNIAELAKERIRRAISKIKDEQKVKEKHKVNKLSFGEEKDVPQLDLGFKVFKLQPSSFKVWRGDQFENGEQLEKQLEVFTDPTQKGSEEENMLYELLLKSGFDLNCRIEHKGNFYVVNDREMVVALIQINEAIVKEILALNPTKCIALDKLFAGNDQLKTNTVLQMKDAGVEFKTI